MIMHITSFSKISEDLGQLWANGCLPAVYKGEKSLAPQAATFPNAPDKSKNNLFNMIPVKAFGNLPANKVRRFQLVPFWNCQGDVYFWFSSTDEYLPVQWLLGHCRHVLFITTSTFFFSGLHSTIFSHPPLSLPKQHSAEPQSINPTFALF